MKKDFYHMITFPRQFTGSSLFCIFSLAYIAGPYWTIHPSLFIRLLLLVVTIGMALFFAYYSSGDLQVRLNNYDFISFLVLFLILLLLNHRTLISAIPMRGDEDYHIIVILDFARKVTATVNFHIPFILLTGLFLFTAFRKSKYYIIFGTGVLFYFILFGASEQASHSTILRYPFFSRTFQVIVPIIVNFFDNLYIEISYRVAPFVSAILLAWLSQRYRPFPDRILNLMFGIAIGTMPLVYYYSSVVYLEMPAVVLIMIVCFQMEALLNDDFQKLKQQPAWYALITLGFIKETTLLFLLLFMIFRIANQLCLTIRCKKNFLSNGFRELSIGLCTLLPVFIYLLYRSYYGTSRNTSFEIINLTKFEIYPVILQSFFDQFGFFLILFVAGCLLFVKKRQFLALSFALSTIIAYSLFYAIENTIYSGYSRFNLFSLPLIISISKELLYDLRHKKILVCSLILIAIISNIRLSPIHMDGTRIPLWGNYLVDTSEHSYPYPETIQWLKKNHKSSIILFSGMNSPYFFSFYFHKYGWTPPSNMMKSNYRDDEKTSLMIALEKAEASNYDIVIFQLRNNKMPKTDNQYGFRLEKIIRNQAHSIGIFIKTDLYRSPRTKSPTASTPF
ncbi:MAG: hypothetical protein C0403_10620 [Desulfobacterium sp.]|nr:hypothetical protein [Desulfobacterium sp.]